MNFGSLKGFMGFGVASMDGVNLFRDCTSITFAIGLLYVT